MTTLHRHRVADELVDEHGFTLIEIAITTMLLSLVLAMIVQAMVSVQTAVDREAGRNTRNDRLQLAVFTLERQIRSGNVISDPALLNNPSKGIVPGMAVRVYTQADAGTAGERCVEWRVNGGRLESRDWSPDWQIGGDYDTSWSILADGIRNRDVTPNVAAFFRPNNRVYGLRMLQVTLVADGSGASGGGNEKNLQRIRTSITGRNTGFPYPANICNNAPAYP